MKKNIAKKYLAMLALLFAITQPVYAEQCVISGASSDAMSCSNTSAADILTKYDGAQISKNASSKDPIRIYDSCYYIDNTSSKDSYFIPFKTAAEYQSFITNSPASVSITACATDANGATIRGDVIKKAGTGKQLALSLPAPQTIVDVAAGNPNFSTLVTLVQAAGLVDTLKSTGPFTVFAPTNAAFAKLSPETIAFLSNPANKQVLVSILTYHVLPGKALLADIAGKRLVVKTVQNFDVRVAGNENPAKVNTSNIIQTDIMASNGVIHAIDTVLSVPENTLEKLKKSPQFSTLLALASPFDDIVSRLAGYYDVTLFAPTNAAFAALPTQLVTNITKPENKDILQAVLNYHILGIKLPTQDVIGKSVRVNTVAGPTVNINGTVNSLKVNQSNITYPDEVASYGLIHVIDKVLTPPCSPVRRSVRVENCPAGQQGQIKKQTSLSCPFYDTVETVIQNTCKSNTCTPGQTSTTQSCPAGQTGNITTTTQKICDGSNNGAGRTQTTTSSTCRASETCTPRFLGYSYGSCGNGRYGLVIYSVNRTCPGNRLNYNVVYRSCFKNWW